MTSHQSNTIATTCNTKRKNNRTLSSCANSSASRGGVRRQKGTSLLEMPVMLGVVLIGIFMPMLALATITLKSALMSAAVQDGAFLASKAKTFQTGTSDKPAAVTLANVTIRGNAKKFLGLDVDSVSTDIIITPVDGGPPTRTSAKLTVPADTSKFIYQIETVAKGQIEPLFHVNPKIVGSIPGVSTPVLVSYSAREMSENPQGLNQ